MTDLVLNVKQIALRMEGDQPKRLALSATGPGDEQVALSPGQG
jgi:DNA-directed RNA polymerase subunit alpha